ncbi:TPA: hypothetical protein ACGO42_000429 [Streptococcus suis]
MGHNHKKYNWFLLLLALGFIINYWYILVPIGLLVGYVYKRDDIHRFLNSDQIKRIQTLIFSIRSGYEKHQELLAEKGENQSVLQLRKRLLGQLFELDQLYQKVGKYLDAYASKEAVDTLQLKYQLKLPETKVEKETSEQVSPSGGKVMDEKAMISEIAPEILETYCNIQRDNLVILEKLENTSDKKEELTAIHEANMQRFNDIFTRICKNKEIAKRLFQRRRTLDTGKIGHGKFR